MLWRRMRERFKTTALVLILAQISSILIRQSDAQSNDVRGEMIPNTKHQIVETNSTLVLTCIYGHSYNVSWELPDFISRFPELSKAEDRLSVSWESNETHSSSTMRLAQVTTRDSGHYRCHLTTQKRWYVKAFEIEQYVYITNGTELLINMDDINREESNTLLRYVLKHGEPGHVACKPAHPDVTVTLQRINPPDDDKSVQRNLLALPNSRWMLEPTKGLTLKKVTLDDFGDYECVGTMNDVTDRKIFRIVVSGIEVIREGGVSDPAEGDNATLICQANLFSLPPEWAYMNTYTRKLYDLDDYSPPTGLKITTEKFDAPGEDLAIYKSRLELFNITMDSKTHFQCRVKSEHATVSKAISFRVREPPVPFTKFNNNPVSSVVEIQEGRPRNLTCFGLPQHNIRWVKNGKEYLGDIYYEGNSSTVRLKGFANETGTYACRNNYGERYRHFTVTLDNGELSETEKIAIAVSLTLLFLIGAGVSIGLKLYLDKRRKMLFPGAEELLKGSPAEINEQMCIDQQTELLPYDIRWEFPRNRLKLGIQLGAGCFGRVVKAEAMGINGIKDNVKTVAVKMVRSQANVAALEALVSELKILIYLGSHLNVVNLLGACTKHITRGKLLIIVEYCRYGNLQTYLINHRKNFINQVDETGKLNPSVIVPIMEADSMMAVRKSNEYVLYDPKEARNELECETPNENSTDFSTNSTTDDVSDNSGLPSVESIEDGSDEPESFWHNHQDPDGNILNQTVSTRDLISWSFQVARGMDYLVQKKLFHGDLAARNVLLADNGVVKVADFGMARQLYYEGNYHSKGQGPMPVKWMAIESLTERIFSSKSDIWSYGIFLWELFSLGKIPYPGMDADQELIRQLQSGYRLEKPDYAPITFGDIMTDCWKKDPNERPTFSQLEERITGLLETTVSSYYWNLNVFYEKLNKEKENAKTTDQFGLAKLLNEKWKLEKSLSQPIGDPLPHRAERKLSYQKPGYFPQHPCLKN